MNINEKFSFTSKFGTTYPIAQFQVFRYASTGNLALSISVYDEEGEYWEPYATITTNLDFSLDDSQIAIKNYSENEGMLKLLIDMGLIEPNSVGEVHSGFVVIPIHNLTESGKELFEGQ